MGRGFRLAPGAGSEQAPAMFMPALSLISGLLVLAALLRVGCRLAADCTLPWARAFGLSALIGLVYRGLLLALAGFSEPGTPPPLPLLLGVVLVTILAAAGLTGWIAREASGQPIGFRRGALANGVWVLFIGALVATLYATQP